MRIVGEVRCFRFEQPETTYVGQEVKTSQIIQAFEEKVDNPFVGNFMFNFCDRSDGPKFRQSFVEGLDYRYKTISGPYYPEKNEANIAHFFTAECEHGWLSRKQIANFMLDLSKDPDMIIAIELEHSIKSIRNQCDLCRMA